MNLSTLTASKLIPFEDELRHIKTFLSLEKTRFNNRLNIVYELGPTDFDLPPLSIQPLVENAVKHGILKKVEGGTVILKTSETPNDYVIEVIDDGVGFAMEGVDFDHNEHLGLKNIAYRISRSGGKLNIESKPGQGCKATVTFKK